MATRDSRAYRSWMKLSIKMKVAGFYGLENKANVLSGL